MSGTSIIAKISMSLISWVLPLKPVYRTHIVTKRYLWSIEKEKGRLRFFFTMDSAGGAEAPKAPPPP